MVPPRVLVSFMSLASVQQRQVFIPGLVAQIGQRVLCSLNNEGTGERFSVACYVVGVHVDVDVPTFDLAFPVAGQPDLYVPVRSLHADIILHPDETPAVPPADVPVPPGHAAMDRILNEPWSGPERRRPQLSVVRAAVNKDEHLAMGEAAAQVVTSSPADAKPITLEFAMDRAVYTAMVSQMPGGSLVHDETKHAFQITYVSEDVAEAEIRRFNDTFPGRVSKVKRVWQG